MPKALSVASWNVKHFTDGDHDRADRVVAFLSKQTPDVIGIYEVSGKEVWRELMDRMEGYSFFITEGANSQEILVGIRKDVTAFVTQRLEFQSGLSAMRPGALVNARVDGNDYQLLFLHVASMNDPRGFGIRADMLQRAIDLKKTLDGASVNGRANYLFLGDLNTMGMRFEYDKQPDEHRRQRIQRDEVLPEREIGGLDWRARSVGMRLLTKTHELTYRSAGDLRGNLDHVVASEHLKFNPMGAAEVAVMGWPELAEAAEQTKWVKSHSDHGLLYFEVQAP